MTVKEKLKAIDESNARNRRKAKEFRIFSHYMDRLTENGTAKQVRMLTIEYLCLEPDIDPIKMAKEIVKSGIPVVFDDSTITKKQNEELRRKVYGRKAE